MSANHAAAMAVALPSIDLRLALDALDPTTTTTTTTVVGGNQGRGRGRGRGGAAQNDTDEETTEDASTIHNLEELARAIGQPIACVRNYPIQTITSIALALNLPALTQATLLGEHATHAMAAPKQGSGAAAATAGSDDPSIAAINVLSKHLVDQAARSDQPWKTTWARIRKALATYDQMTTASLKQTLADRAKLGTISTTESLICNLIFFCDPKTRHKIGAAILNSTGSDLVSVVNVVLAEAQADPTFIDQHGARILRMAGPLYPIDQTFSSLNHQAICGSEVTGAGHDPKRTKMPDRPLFRAAKPRSGDYEGGGYIPVGPIGDALFADVTAIEQSVLPRLDQIEKTLKTLARSAPRTIKFQDPIRSRGGARGRGGDRGRGGRGRGGRMIGRGADDGDDQVSDQGEA